MSLLTTVRFIGVVPGYRLFDLTRQMTVNVGDTTAVRDHINIDAYCEAIIIYNYLDFSAFRARYKEVFGGKDDFLSVVIDDEREDKVYIFNPKESE